MVEFVNEYEPSKVSPPGATLADILEERGMSQRELADRMGRPIKTVNEIIRGKAAITPETAMQLEQVLGAPARFWVRREAQYRESLARRERMTELAGYVDWLEEVPYSALRKLNWIPNIRKGPELVREVLTFYGVASPHEWNKLATSRRASFRLATRQRVDYAAVDAWLCKGEIEAATIPCREYDKARFEEALLKIRNLTRMPPEELEPIMIDLCSASGVALAFVQPVRGARVSGAARWLTPTRALIQLSLYGKFNDRFWFTFFHEAAHILYHKKKDLFLDDGPGTGAEEEEANQFAADTLIPPEWTTHLEDVGFDEHKVVELAQRIGIHPGILVGRMQHDGLIPQSHLNGLKERYEIKAE